MKDQQKKQQRNPDVHDPSKIQHKTPHKASVGKPGKQDRPDPGKTHKVEDDPKRATQKVPMEEPGKRDS